MPSSNFWKIAQGINLTPKTAAPSSPSNGDMYYNSTSNTFQFYQNGAFVAYHTSGGVGLFGDGSSSAPAMSFTSDTDVGFYRVASNTIGFASNSTVVMTASDALFKVFTDFQSVGHILAADGTVGAPAISFTNDSDTGLYSIGANNLGFATAGVIAGSIDASEQWILGSANASARTHAFYKDVNAGDTTTALTVKIGNSGTNAGAGQLIYTNAAAAGAPQFQINSTVRNNADTGTVTTVRLQMLKTAATDSGDFRIATSNAGTLANGIQLSGIQNLILGSTSSTSHTLAGNIFTMTSNTSNDADFRVTAATGQKALYTGRGKVAAVQNQVDWYSYFNDGTTDRQLALIRANNTNTTASSSGGQLEFHTTTTAGTLTKAFSINETQAFTLGVDSNNTNSILGRTTQSLSTSGVVQRFRVENTDNTNTANRTEIVASVGGGSAGDAQYQAIVTGATTWTWGIDNSVSDQFALAATTSLGSSDLLQITTAGAWTIGTSGGTQDHTINGNNTNLFGTSASNCTLGVRNSDNTGGNARFYAEVGGSSAGDPYTLYNISGVQNWATGVDNSDSDKFKISGSNALGSSDYVTITTAGLITLGTGTATQHALNTQLATNGAQNATLTNLPAAATAGNPVGWVQITINGTTRYMPFW